MHCIWLVVSNPSAKYLCEAAANFSERNHASHFLMRVLDTLRALVWSTLHIRRLWQLDDTMMMACILRDTLCSGKT